MGLKRVRSHGQLLRNLRQSSQHERTAVGDQWTVLNQAGDPLKNMIGFMAQFEQMDYFFSLNPRLSSWLGATGEVVFVKYFPWLRDSAHFNQWLFDMVAVLLIIRLEDGRARRIASFFLRLDDWLAANPQPGVVEIV
jgi:hypothetical protein